MKIGIYGGTFDPPHMGHMQAAKAAIEALELDELVVIPTSVPPHKSLSSQSASSHDRLQMVTRLADEMGKKTNVSDMEIRRGGKSYTIDTLETLQTNHPDAEWFLLMGSDMFFSFDTWHRAKDIAKRATLAPFFREESDSKEAFHLQACKLNDSLQAKVAHISLSKVYPMSSTQIRESLVNHEEIADHLPVLVYGYILGEGLYGTKQSMKHLPFDQLRAVSLSMVKAKRVPHIDATAETAVALAKRWGADTALARRSGILHDCTKYFTREEHLEICEKYGIVLDELEQKYDKLLHARTGSALARYVFGEDDAVWQAIDCHTTAKAYMTTLDKILYLADYIEPNRDFDGVERLRRYAEEDLDKAMIEALEQTVEELKAKKAPMHSNALRALNQLKEA